MIKNALLCASAATSYEAKAVLKGSQGETISSVRTIKTLGYLLDADCGQTSNVKAICSKLRARTWALPVLKRSGYQQEDIVRIFCSMIRPTVEYCSPAWGSLLTQQQSTDIERQQIQALKHIFGAKISARKLRELAGVKSLEPKRGRRLSVGHRLYEESTFRTDRHLNSPKNYLRRLLNLSLIHI